MTKGERSEPAVVPPCTAFFWERAKKNMTPALNTLDERPLLGLVMIVKNEADRIASVLKTYRDFVDRWTILDTGSTDGTQNIIRDALLGVPGQLFEEPFVDFATSRNRALELHGTSTVFSIMPNGDLLVGGQALRAFLQGRRTAAAGSYMVRIAPGHYFHPLVMRTDSDWRYRWRTHECAQGSNGGGQIPDVSVIRDRGHRTPEQWKVRWERDLELLHLDRQADPADPRPYFYLGQTYECLGHHALALANYERRTEMGGYFDEVYEAKFRIAKMKRVLGRSWAEVQQAFLEAHAHDPRRAEPLYALAEHWFNENHNVARIFAVAAAELPKPPVSLFLDQAVYTWQAADKAAISSFYAGQKEQGRHFAAQAVKAQPHDERLRANEAFFAPSAAEMFGAQSQGIRFSPEAGWYASNPSIARDPSGRTRCIVRTVNYRIENGCYVTPPQDKGVIRTRNFLLDLDQNLETIRVVEMIDATGDPRTNYVIQGFEDARLFFWKGYWWATATACHLTGTEEGRREIALLELGSGNNEEGEIVSVTPLRGPWSERAQKNWMPLVSGVSNQRAQLVYETHPSIVFELDDSQLGITCSRPSTFSSLEHGRLRGGSQLIRVQDHDPLSGYGDRDDWLFIVHTVAFPGSGRMYLHRFGSFDRDLKLTALSDPFYFEQLGIEFCAGLCVNQGSASDRDSSGRVRPLELIASYAVNDGSARLARFSTDAVLRSLRKDFTI